MCMIATETQRDEGLLADAIINKKQGSASGYTQQRLQSSAEEAILAVDEQYKGVTTVVLNHDAAENHCTSVARPSPGSCKEGDSSVLEDKNRAAPAPVWEGTTCASKKATHSKKRIQVIVRIRPIHHGAARYRISRTTCT